jgi:hypothetical protein
MPIGVRMAPLLLVPGPPPSRRAPGGAGAPVNSGLGPRAGEPNVVRTAQEGAMKTCRNDDCPDADQSVYPDDTPYCPRCAGTLEPATEAEVAHATREKLPEDFVCAARLVGAAQVAVAKSLLDSAAFEYFLTNEISQDLFGWGQLFTGYNVAIGGVGVWVHKDDLESASQLLAGLAPDQPDQSNPSDEEAPSTA